MARKRPSNFRVRFDEDDADTIYRTEVENVKIEKLGQRVTLLTILIPCLLGIVLFIGYLDIKDRLTETSYTGAKGVERLSKDMESRFSSLSVKQARLEENEAKTAKTIAADTKALAELEKQIKTNAARDGKAIAAVAEGKVDKKELAPLNAAVSRLDKSLAPLVNDLAALNVKLEASDTRTANEVKALSKTVQTLKENLAKLQDQTNALGKDLKRQTKALSEQKVDGQTLATKIEEATGPINDRVAELLKRVGLLQAEVSALSMPPLQKPETLQKETPPAKNDTAAKTEPEPAKKSEPAPAHETKPASSKEKPPLKKALPKPDKIQEEVLKE